MNAVETTTVHPDALIGWHALPSEEKDRLRALLGDLAARPEKDWLAAGARRLGSDEPLFVVPAAGGLLVVFRLREDGALEVRHLVLRETIERYPWHRVNGAHP